MPEYMGSIQQAAQKQNKDKTNKKGKKSATNEKAWMPRNQETHPRRMRESVRSWSIHKGTSGEDASI